jgi:hypothetical protein
MMLDIVIGVTKLQMGISSGLYFKDLWSNINYSLTDYTFKHGYHNI